MNPQNPFNLSTERRAFLKLLGAAAVIGAGMSLSGCDIPEPVPTGFEFLDESTYPVIKAFSRRIIPSGGAFPIAADDVDVLKYFDTIVSSQPPEIQKDMKSGILLLEHKALLFRFSFTRFSRMSPNLQDEYLKSWEESSVSLFRGVFWGFKKICCLGFYSSQKVWPYIGYDGKWIK